MVDWMYSTRLDEYVLANNEIGWMADLRVDNHDEIIDWCHDMLKDSWTVRTYTIDYVHGIYKADQLYQQYKIDSDTDFMLFKMTWCNRNG